MFEVRLVAVALSIFILSYLSLSLAVIVAWNLPARLLRSYSPFRAANLLLALRLFPLFGALAITALYGVPSFLVLEPGEISEPVGPLLIVLVCISIGWVLIAAWRAVNAQKTLSRILSQWIKKVRVVDARHSVPVLQISSDDPVLAVAGICAPKVLVSQIAASTLSAEEFEAALRHEMAHIRHRDNLKKLLFRFASFPAMDKLESAWADMCEMAADDAAISNTAEALDLASALIKLSRLVPIQAAHGLTSSLMPPVKASLEARVRRLFNWTDSDSRSKNRSFLYSTPALVGIFLCAVLTYGPVLAQVHEVTEWLVR